MTGMAAMAPVQAQQSAGETALVNLSAAQTGYVSAYSRIDPSPAGPKHSPYMREVISAKGGSKVPVLMPYSMTSDEEAATYHRVAMRVQKNGYTGVLHQPGLDIVITGSKDAPQRSGLAGATETGSNYSHGFREFPDRRGGKYSFGWSGSDYQVEFHCHGLDQPGHGNCMTPEKAEGFVKEMLAGN
jgi:hypothetical protein